MSHFIYQKSNIELYKPEFTATRKDGSPQCAESVHDDGRWPSFHQCVRKGVVEEVVNGKTYTFCKVHSLTEQTRRQAARRSAYDEAQLKNRPSYAAYVMVRLLRSLRETWDQDMVVGPNSEEAQKTKDILDYIDGKREHT
jgi:hypothetical protein